MICEMCGEEIDELVCPFCLTEQTFVETRSSKKKSSMVKVNIKDDMPLAETAIERLQSEITKATKNGTRALKIVHGYGSSGRGGIIKQEVHRYLMGCADIVGWIPGEEFSAEFSETLDLLKSRPYLESDSDFRRRNKGVTIIVL